MGIIYGKKLNVDNPYNDGMIGLLQYYAEEYKRHKREGKSFPKSLVNCDSIMKICKSISRIYKIELNDLRKPECVAYAKRFTTDQETLADILSLIYYILN